MQQTIITLFILNSFIGIHLISKEFNETIGEFILKIIINICSLFFFGNIWVFILIIIKISDFKILNKKYASKTTFNIKRKRT